MPQVTVTINGRNFRMACDEGQEQHLEGVVAKRHGSPYRPGRRSRDWVKVKTATHGEFLIAGFTRGAGSRAALGALVLAEQGCISYAPVVDTETGFPSQAKIGPDRVNVIEQWESLDALKAHAVAPHMKAYRVAVKDYVKGTTLQIFSPA